MPPALIFDLDGTLVHSLPGIARSLNHALAEENLPTHPESAVRGFIGDGSLVLAQRALPAGSPDSLAHDLEGAFKRHYAETWREGSTLYPGIEDLISSLARDGRALAILSNKPHPFTCEFAEHFFPNGTFSQVLGQSPETAKKPAPDTARTILGNWGIAPEMARFIGDSTVDRQTASNAEIPFVAVAWGYHDPEYLGPKIAASAEELATFLA